MTNISAKTRITLICLAFICLAIAVGSAEPVRGADAGNLQVTILLYAGRPDPTYLLTDQAVVARLEKLMAAAAKAGNYDKTTVIPSRLGYKGIMIDNRTGGTRLPASFAVYRGMIEVGTERKEFLRDEGNTVENLLLEGALKSGALDEQTLGFIRSDELK